MRTDLLKQAVWQTGTCGPHFQLDVFEERDGHVLEGLLRTSDEDCYPITSGVPCFLRGRMRPDFTEFEQKHGLVLANSDEPRSISQQQRDTVETFSDKWRRFRSYGLQPNHQEFLFEWYCQKLGLAGLDELKAFYQSKNCILEVGPGSGFNSRFMAENCPGQVFAADISAAAHTTFENTRHLSNCHVIQSDLMELPFASGTFDFIIADGVLHHTPNTRAAVEALYRKLRPGGQFFFYVYKKMGAARQFCDRHINQTFSKLEPEKCYQACEGLTELGRELSRLGAKIKLEIGIPILGIPPGEHDVQRLIYYNFVKCFWNEAFDFETNNMVNFDWYHAAYAWQHTEEEVQGWLDELNVTEFVFNSANPNGISVLLRKKS